MTFWQAPVGYRVEILDEVGSTNAVAFERAEAGAASGLWIVARRQNAGRGRQGRVWASDEGNLYSSLMLRDPAPADRISELPLVVALAVHDAVAAALPPPVRGSLRIKWPNDVLFAGAKLSGILVEGKLGADGRVVVIGIGINCRHHPETALYPATDMATLGSPTTAPELFEILADRLSRRLAEWSRGDFAPLRAAWIARAAGIGAPITVRLPTGERTGIFDGLDDDGRLLLRGDGRIDAIAAGDVFLLE